jgi:hypothetical protein
MNVSRRVFFGALTAPLLLCLAVGCTGADNPKIADAPPPPAPTEADKAAPTGKPKGYGEGSAYQKAMEKAANR